jgi:hypothetical protein
MAHRIHRIHRIRILPIPSVCSVYPVGICQFASVVLYFSWNLTELVQLTTFTIPIGELYDRILADSRWSRKTNLKKNMQNAGFLSLGLLLLTLNEC